MKGIIIAIVAVASVAACGRGGPPEDQPTGSIDSAAWREARELPPAFAAALDSGNSAFRARDLEAARAHYRRAIELDPEQSAGWFGLSMVEGQLGNTAAADSAMERVRQLTPGASLVHPNDTTPRNHP
ncbi:MAG TPA: tetratricopeptide repeat protein [Longimicrobiales bacterium]